MRLQSGENRPDSMIAFVVIGIKWNTLEVVKIYFKANDVVGAPLYFLHAFLVVNMRSI